MIFGSCAFSGVSRYADPTALISWSKTISGWDTFIAMKARFDLMLLPVFAFAPVITME